MNCNSNSNIVDSPEERAFRKLRESSLFQTWKQAFSDATGMSMELVPADLEDSRALCSVGSNRFCSMLHGGNSCAGCTHAHISVLDSARDKMRTSTCFAGMRETAVPVKAGGRVVGWLRTGQVFENKQTREDFAPVAGRLEREGMATRKIEKLREAWIETPVVEGTRYQGTITLLAAFSLQLAAELDRLLIAEENVEPPVIRKARQYVNANLEERITLDAVASHVSVSPFYFCKLFKQTTGMTLTEYINRRRVEWAKRKLLNPHARVTEVAYDVGYQSLSQFNRSFLRYAGESPTSFRERSLDDRQFRAA